MTLTEFLLARIAEDEAKAQMTRQSWPALIRTDRPRAIVECEAKRRIVGEHPIGPADDCSTCSYWPEHPCPTLRFLALPYAGHPDYREEWKP